MASGDLAEDGGNRRGRPRRISRRQIVEAAVEIGLDSFSIQGIADHLGVTAPALYTHVDGRDEIVELVAADLFGRLDVPVDDATDWRDWLIEFGHQVRTHFADAGRALQVDLSGPLAVHKLALGERGVALLMRAGFSAADAGKILWLVFRVACTAGSPAGASVEVPMTAARSIAGEGTMPSIDRAIEEIGSGTQADTFAFDLRVVVEGLDAMLGRS